MGLIRLVRSIKRPIQNAAHAMNAQHAAVTRRAFMGRTAAGVGFAALLRRHNVKVQDPRAGLWFPEDLDENQLSTYPCDPESGDEIYSDANVQTLNQNPVAITAAAVQLARENRRRSAMFIVNVSVSSILIAFGFIPTTTVYTLPLQACGSANDGTGGIIIDENWRGTVWAILAQGAANGSLLFTELPEWEKH